MALYKVWHTESGRNPRQYKAASRNEAALLWVDEGAVDTVEVSVEFVKTGTVTNHRVVRRVKYNIKEI